MATLIIESYHPADNAVQSRQPTVELLVKFALLAILRNPGIEVFPIRTSL